MNLSRMMFLLTVCCLAQAVAGVQARSSAQVPQSAAPVPAQTAPQAVPNAPLPVAKPLQTRPDMSPEDAAEALRISKLARINGEPYDQPSLHDTLIDYYKDTYGVSGAVRTISRALFAQFRQKPESWNFGERLGSSEGTTIISGNVRLGMELAFHEDLRYLACNGCSLGKKIENVLLAEVTARHDEDGHRFFTLTPTVADFSGPIIAHTLWYPAGGGGPLAGFVSARTVFAARVGQRVLVEIFLDPSKKKKKTEMGSAKPANTTNP